MRGLYFLAGGVCSILHCTLYTTQTYIAGTEKLFPSKGLNRILSFCQSEKRTSKVVFRRFNCSCPAGLKYNSPNNTCDDVNECLLNPCVNADCVNTFGNFECSCDSGYEYYNKTLVQIYDGTASSKKNFLVLIVILDTYENITYYFRHCKDIDECQIFPHPYCDQNCTNSPGSYQCSCFYGTH